MTRAERRRLERRSVKKPTYNLSGEQLKGMKQEAAREAAETAFPFDAGDTGINV